MRDQGKFQGVTVTIKRPAMADNSGEATSGFAADEDTGTADDSIQTEPVRSVPNELIDNLKANFRRRRRLVEWDNNKPILTIRYDGDFFASSGGDESEIFPGASPPFVFSTQLETSVFEPLRLKEIQNLDAIWSVT